MQEIVLIDISSPPNSVTPQLCSLLVFNEMVLAMLLLDRVEAHGQERERFFDLYEHPDLLDIPLVAARGVSSALRCPELGSDLPRFHQHSGVDEMDPLPRMRRSAVGGRHAACRCWAGSTDLQNLCQMAMEIRVQ